MSTLLQWRPMSVLLACSVRVGYAGIVASTVAIKNAGGLQNNGKNQLTRVLNAAWG